MIVTLSACATTPVTPPPVATFSMISTTGQPAGSIALVTSGAGYRLLGNVSGLPAGSHGIHIHAVGRCDGPAFTTAGGHLNPAMHEHGVLNPKGAHMGDLQNIAVIADGTGQIDLPLQGTRAQLDAGLFDADGTALVIHAAADDYRTDPTGNSGARIACGILVRT
ncbi:superoxide dismutase family protein [Novosphingobium flavum]|uniref:Superoxide dismutase family protein n=2 Tax=Novosphingobium flavum TaxID=1778672 RepID=A0A7X1KKY3_9SPHN|nr:superoxide dismutase family protein [Novosphingobium flavum]MBC2665039.1 superoxide dismutase family protein [Novosphingobium flavum]